jgi:hypothetical protein
MRTTKAEDFEFKELLAQYRLSIMREEDDLSKRPKETVWTARRQEFEAELLCRLGAAVAASPQPPTVDDLAMVMAYQHRTHTPESRKELWDREPETNPWKLQWRDTARLVLATFFAPAPAQELPKEVIENAVSGLDDPIREVMSTETEIRANTRACSESASVASLKTSGLAAQHVENSTHVANSPKWCSHRDSTLSDEQLKSFKFCPWCGSEMPPVENSGRCRHCGQNAATHGMYCPIPGNYQFAPEPISGGASRLTGTEVKGHLCPNCHMPISWVFGNGWAHDSDGVNIFHCRGGASTGEQPRELIDQYWGPPARPSEPSRAKYEWRGAAQGTPQVEEIARELAEAIRSWQGCLGYEDCTTPDDVYAMVLRKHLPGAPAQPGPEEKR